MEYSGAASEFQACPANVVLAQEAGGAALEGLVPIMEVKNNSRTLVAPKLTVNLLILLDFVSTYFSWWVVIIGMPRYLSRTTLRQG